MNTLELHNKKHHTIPTLTEIEEKRFWKKVQRGSLDECWLWTGKTTRGIHGGGKYGLWTVQGLNLRPHRVAYTLLVGPIPEGLTLDHVRPRCTSSLCCNPYHLEPVTQSENIKRHYDFIGTPTVCKSGHPRERGKPCKGCAKRDQQLYKERHPEKARELARNQKRKERERKKQLVPA